nr:DUF2064 domain-containing protein [Solirubrobacterales bacterium]
PSRRLVAFAGDPRGWVPRRFEVVGQPDGDLLHRLTVAFSEVGGPALLIGTRTPQLTPRLLDSALAALLEADTEAVLGPTQSERVWAIGLRGRDPRLLRSGTDGDPTDSGTVRARLSASGLRIAELARLRAVETFSDAVAVAEETPNRRFVEALGALPFGADPANA